MAEPMILDAEGTVRMLRLAVFEKGADYVYPGDKGSTCWNFVDGEPSCIVGTVLNMLGLTYEKACELKIDGSSDSWDSTRTLNEDEDFGWVFSDDARRLLSVAQWVQDDRRSWGEALAKVEAAWVQMQEVSK